MNINKLVVVCGPTASGKTSLAVQIAKKISGEIISADSRQVYKGMDIGTGKDLIEYQGDNFSVPYHLIDICEPSYVYTLYDFVNDFYTTLSDVASRNAIPVLTGGTGLYIEAVLRKYDIPSIPEDSDFRNAHMTKDKDWLIAELEKTAPDLYKKTDLGSKKRVVRALEVAKYRNDSNNVTVERPELDAVILCTKWERSVLWKRIDKRLEERLSAGMGDEVQRLLDSGLSRDRFSLFGMEYKFVARYLDKEISYNEMVATLKIAIHQLAKRQETYFRGMERRGLTVHWIENADKVQAFDILSKWEL